MKNHLSMGTETFRTSLRFKKTTVKIRRIIFLLFIICTNSHLVDAQSPAQLDYLETFEGSTTDWKLINGNQANYWKIGARSGTSVELFITNGTGTTNNYVGTKSVVHAYREIAIPNGVANISIDYAYKCVGNSNSYFRVWIVPATFTPEAGTAITADAGGILINSGQSSNSWVDPSALKTAKVDAFAGSTIRLVYEWINSEGAVINSPGAAIDKINVRNLCKTSLSAIQGGALTVCSGSITNAFTNTTMGGSWSIINGTGSATISTFGVVTGGLPGTVKVRYTANNCFQSVNLTVYAIPSATTVSGAGTFCGSTLITASGGTGGTIYFQGTTSGGTSITTASSSQTVSATGTYYFRSRSAEGCWGSEGSVAVTKEADASALVASSITTNSAQLTWTGAGSYIVEYGASGFSPGSGASAGTGGTIASSNSTSPFSLTGLLAITNYDVYVRRINCPSAGMFGVNSPKVSFKTLAPCVAPTALPIALNLTAISTTQIDGSFTAASPVASGYLVIRSTSATLTGNPVDGTTYIAGNALGGGIVVSSGTGTTFSDTGLTVSTTYYYFVISYNNTSCVGGPKYLTATPLSGSRATLCPTATALSASKITQTTAQISWTGSGTYIIEYGLPGFTPGNGATAGTGGAIATNSGTSPYNITGLAPTTNYRVYIRQVCALGGFSANSTALNFTTLCRPTTTTAANSYIADVRFLGTLKDVENDMNGSGGSGYQDFTNMANKTMQAAGEGVNIFVKSNNVDTSWKAWVDWDRNGTFNNTNYNEISNPTGEVMFSTGIQAISTTFGFIIPKGIVPGDYVIRIRNYRVTCTSTSGFCGSTTYTACESFTGSTYGEAEDYIITVTANCASVINSVTLENPATPYCGASNIPLVAKASTGTTKIRWYNAENGGTMLAEKDAILVGGVLQATYTTPLISSSTTYWVTSFNGTCETIYRKPVTAKVKPVPVLSFNLPSSNANFCGDDDRLILTTSGNQELVTLIDEDFEGKTTLGDFSVTNGPINNSTVSETQWQNQGSPFKPKGAIWSPVISSGYAPNKFAFATSDYGTRKVETILTSTISHPTTNFTSLDLSFSAYYSFYGDTSANAGGIVEGFFVEVSTDNGGIWTTVKTYDAANPGLDGTPSLGYGTRFRNLSVNLDAYKNLPSVKIRFRYKAYWGDGVAIDNIKLYGQRPLSNSFTWDAPNIGVFQADCITSYPEGTATTGICIKPTDLQLQTISDWNITAYQTVSNTCTSSASITIHNNNKVWDTTASTTWGATDKWLPTNEIPDTGKCVIVKKPVNLVNGDGFAKNIKIMPGGSLTIKKDKSLTVTDFIRNETTPLATNESNLVVETDGNLIQLNNGAANSGRMTAQRLVNGLRYNPGSAVDYVYWSSPVAGQKTKNTTGNTDGFSSGTANTNFFTYRESNDRFYETGDPTFTLGKGYAVQAERNKGSLPFDRLFEFKGTPNNGDIGFPLAFTNASHGYNLVGNPYPSNINFEQLHYGNSSLIWGTAWFWTNNVYTANQMGSGYTGNNYAIWNGSGGVGATSPYEGGKVPNGIVKVGQAFIVQAKSAGTLNFKNKYDDAHVLRVNTTGDFYSKNSTPKNRFLIQLLSPSQLSNSQLIAYVEGATDGFEQDYDAEAFGSYSDLFYSIIPGKKLVIQGKSEAFNNEDKVILGANFFQNGTYTIALENAEGIFNGSQNIYLKDKQEGIITNLSQGSYTFLATKADNTTRFEIIYKPETVLVTDSKVKEGVVVYRDSDDFVVKAQHKKITSIEVFDVAGRLIYSLTPNSLQTFIPGAKLLNSIYVLKINQGGIITTKKIIK